jgi:deazaflavin-dependent oxidoreductase (nitroreductase family)
MQLPRAVARFNRAVNNPIQGVYAWLLPPWAVIVHRGRRSGRTYRTPVVAFRRGSRFEVAVLYGERSDWVRNLLAAGGGEVVRGGRTYPLREPRVVDAGEAAVAGRIGRFSGRVLVGELGSARGGFGRGPRARG